MARNYSSSDDYMVERSETLQALFEQHMADFTAFDPALDGIFSGAWTNAIEQCIVVTDSETVDDQMMELGQAVEEIMKKCRKKYIEVKYYFELAFAGNRAVMKEMGTDDYERARNRQMRMVFFMENLYLSAEKYKTQLLTSGYTQPRIDEINDLRSELQKANRKQNAFIKGRPVLTQERETIFNACYAYTQRVCEAALSVYYDDDVKRSLFVFQPEPGSSSEFFSGTVNPDSKLQVDDFTYNPAMKFLMQNTGPVALSFYLVNGTDQPVGNIFEINPGDSLEKTAAEFFSAGTALWVKNADSSTAGSFEVEESV